MRSGHYESDMPASRRCSRNSLSVGGLVAGHHDGAYPRATDAIIRVRHDGHLVPPTPRKDRSPVEGSGREQSGRCGPLTATP
jgi:hypothetical protein